MAFGCVAKLKKHGNALYDYFAIFISLLDLVTDILICVEFYQLERMTFFYISLSIIITAQVSYIIAFSSRYWKSLDTCEKIAMTLMILPMAPFMSIAIYIAEKKNIFGTAYNENNGMNLTKSPLRKWMDKKLRSHLGFILEATIEAFPQSILQMCAIVYYEEYTNYIAILSILISMWSVCSKSFVFAAGTSLDRYSIIFNWLCVVCSYVFIQQSFSSILCTDH